MAFVSYELPAMKDWVLENTSYTNWGRMRAFFKKGTGYWSENRPNEVFWNNNPLFIELAPEPNDVDWEFIHTSTK